MAGYVPATLYLFESEVEEMEEIWRDIQGYEGLYQVSNLGNVKSLNYRHRREEHLLKQSINKHGYCFVMLHLNGMVKNVLVHRAVAIAFIENKCNLPLINHKDENRLNNQVENLEWCDQKYNLNYSLSRRKPNKKKRRCNITYTPKKYKEKVFQKNMNGEIVHEYSTVSEAARNNKMSLKSLIACCKGERKTAYGYKWEFAN